MEESLMAATAWLSQKLGDGRILCEACSQACSLKEGEYGLCAIRKVENGELALLTYGLAAAVNIDTIEKQRLFHFMPESRVLSIGTIGCNLSCSFCENYDLSQYPKENNHAIDGRLLSPQQIVDLALKYDCEVIAYTYNEPATYLEYCFDTAKLAREAGLKNVYVTSGYETQKAIDTIAPLIDAMVIDLKAYSDSFYRNICGGTLQPVLDTIQYAHNKGIWIELTTPLIPGHNDADEEIRAISDFLARLDTAIPWHIIPFRPMYKMTDLPPTSTEKLQRAFAIGKESGLEHIYIGSSCPDILHSTHCHGC